MPYNFNLALMQKEEIGNTGEEQNQKVILIYV
jgi:hypothetical protein